MLMAGGEGGNQGVRRLPGVTPGEEEEAGAGGRFPPGLRPLAASLSSHSAYPAHPWGALRPGSHLPRDSLGRLGQK